MADEIQCPNCGLMNPVGSALCENCRSPLPAVEPAQSGESEGPAPDLPEWLASLRGLSGEEQIQPPAAHPEEPPASAAAETEPPVGETHDTPPASTESPAVAPTEDAIPDWLRAMRDEPAEEAEPAQEAEPAEEAATELQPTPAEELPQWLQDLSPYLAQEEAAAVLEQSLEPGADEILLAPAPPEDEETATPQPEAPWSSPWEQREDVVDERAAQAPALVSDEDAGAAGFAAVYEFPEPAVHSEAGEMPAAGPETDWLAALTPAAEDSIPMDAPTAEPAAEAPAAPDDTEPPDWLVQLGVPAGDAITEQAGVEFPAVLAEDAQTPLGEGTPEWLSSLGQVSDETAEAEAGEPAAEGEEPVELAPADLPSWVQAMRPIESVAPESAPPVDQPGFSEPAVAAGPLAGLRGVLPVETDAVRALRTEPIAGRLQVSETQQSYARILEELVANENEPLPPRGQAPRTSLRWQRLAIALVLLGAVIAGNFLRILPGPSLTPLETVAMHESVADLESGDPVLILSDFEPALVGEMQAAGGGVVQHLYQRGARLSVVTSTPTGLVAFQQLVNRLDLPDEQAEWNSVGFLPGGAAGMYDYLTRPLTGEYSRIILLTDGVETGQNWIEQIAAAGESNPRLLEIPVLMVSSAQAAPMLRTYADTRQVDGMLGGLTGGMAYEQMSQGGGGFAGALWNSFQGGMAALVALVLVGGLIVGIVGAVRGRKTRQEA